MIRTEMDSAPAEMDDLRRKIMQHEIEEAALKKETDALSQEHLQELPVRFCFRFHYFPVPFRRLRRLFWARFYLPALFILWRKRQGEE